MRNRRFIQYRMAAVPTESRDWMIHGATNRSGADFETSEKRGGHANITGERAF